MSIAWNLPGSQSSYDPGASGPECDLCGAAADERSYEDLEAERKDLIPGPVDVFCADCRVDLLPLADSTQELRDERDRYRAALNEITDDLADGRLEDALQCALDALHPTTEQKAN